MKWPDDFVNKVICGDCLEVMKQIPGEYIDMAITSPPYWGLRDYGIEQIFGGNKDCKHEWNLQRQSKNMSISDKSTLAGFTSDNIQIRNLKINNEQGFCRKCGAWKGQLGLEPTPEMYIEHMTQIFHEVKRILKKTGTFWLNISDTYSTHTSKRSGQFGKDIKNGFDDIYRQKRILPLQEKCLCMIPERLAWSLIQDGWILRNKIIWHKPNGMPSSAKDRFTNKWEYIFMFSKSRKYFFDLDAVREPHNPKSLNRYKYGLYSVYGDAKAYGGKQSHNFARCKHLEDFVNLLGKNPGDVWSIATQPFPEAHFAVYPEKLLEKPIKAGCPQNGIVLDPFIGSGTTGLMAIKLGRNFIGIELNPEYIKIAKKRLAQEVLPFKNED